MGYGYSGYSPMNVGSSIYGSPYSSSQNRFDVGGTLGKVGGFLTKNAPAVIDALGIGASIYAGHKAGQAQDAALAQQNAQYQQQYGLDQRQVALNERTAQAKLDADAAEKARRQRALMDVLAMGHPAAAAGG